VAAVHGFRKSWGRFWRVFPAIHGGLRIMGEPPVGTGTAASAARSILQLAASNSISSASMGVVVTQALDLGATDARPLV